MTNTYPQRMIEVDLPIKRISAPAAAILTAEGKT